jgi:hypothetical protein
MGFSFQGWYATKQRLLMLQMVGGLSGGPMVTTSDGASDGGANGDDANPNGGDANGDASDDASPTSPVPA